MTFDAIAVATDGSDGSIAAVRWSAELAERTGAKVVAVHVFEPLAHLGDSTPPYDFPAIEQRVRERLESDWTTPLADAGVEYSTVVVHGDPVTGLLGAADDADADVIVVGARGYGVLKGLALGSVSNKLVHVSKRPVTVVPTG
jgi:nucleotide-binding universal stress UspA family protein